MINLGESAQQQAIAFQRRCDLNKDPEYVLMRDAKQAACDHDHKFPNGLCAMCGKWTQVSKWPDAIVFSMAPFGYVVEVRKIRDGDLFVDYQCPHCPYQIGFDSRDGELAMVKKVFREHVDATH